MRFEGLPIAIWHWASGLMQANTFASDLKAQTEPALGPF
jgi:hypothetical protein